MKNKDTILAENLVNYSCKIKAGEKILIEFPLCAKNLVKEIIRQVYKNGAYPFLHITDSELEREILFGTNIEHSKLRTTYMQPIFEDIDAYIGISCEENAFELNDVPNKNIQIYSIYYS